MRKIKRIAVQVYDSSRVSWLREYARARNKRNAVFIWIPKTAGTSLYTALGAAKLHSLHRIERRFCGRGVVTFGHMDYPELVKKGYVPEHFDRTAFKFAFSRNPYERAVSLYFYVKKNGKLSTDESFLSFCRRLKEKGCEPIGLYNVRGLSQCNPQVRWIENIEMNFVGKIETFAEDASALFGNLGQRPVPVPHKNATTHADYRSYYCSESQNIVEEFYEEDFRYFGYQREDVLG